MTPKALGLEQRRRRQQPLPASPTAIQTPIQKVFQTDTQKVIQPDTQTAKGSWGFS